MSNSVDEYCLEMFHQAILHNDQRAREEFQRQLSEAVLGWLLVHPRRDEACCYENEEYYVVQAFEYFWRAIAQDKEVELSTLTAVLKYLQACLDGIIIETLRNYSCSRELSTAEPGYQRKSFSAGHDNSHEVWKNIQSLLSDAREQRLAYLLFHCGLKPREIVQSYPLEYSNLQEILRLRYKVMSGLTTTESSLSFRLTVE
ncbi:MAG: hypothetical protein ACJ8DI_29955 [Ktedonobacteraceae bacterium]